MMSARERAPWFLLEHGIYTVPAPWMKKGPVLAGWNELRIRDFSRYFNGDRQNIAVLTGLNNLADMDFDSEEARWAWRAYARPTGMRWGHASNPDSHWLFYTRGPITSMKYIDPAAGEEGDATLLELRGFDKGGKPYCTLAPPSQHPSDEPYEFTAEGAPATEDGDILMAAARSTATAAMVGRHLGREACDGVRHQGFLALAGALARENDRSKGLKWDVEEAKRFVQAVYWVIWHEAADLHAADLEVISTYDHWFEGKDTTGLRSFASLVDQRVFRRMTQWLSLESQQSHEHQQEAPTKPARTFARAVPLASLKDATIPEREEVVQHYVLNDAVTLLASASKSGKTVLAVAMGMAVASGSALLGHFRVRKAPVLIVERDDQQGKASLKDFFLKCRAADPNAVLDVIYEDPDKPDEVIPLITDPEFPDWLRQQIAEHKAGLCILDSYTALRGLRGAKDVVAIEAGDMQLLGAIARETHCAILLIHHDSKSSAGLDKYSRAAGSFAMQQATETQIIISRFRDLPDADPARQVSVRGRHLEGHQMVLAFRKESLDYDLVLEGAAAEDYADLRLLWAQFPRTAFDAKEVMTEMGWSKHAYKILNRLAAAGVLVKDHSKWTWAKSFTAFDGRARETESDSDGDE